MSLQYHGDRDFDKTDNTSVRFDESTVIQDSEKDISFEKGFCGFQKSPIVVVDRIDVTPYLQAKETVPPVSAATRKGILKKSVYLDQFTMRCAVNIFRDDLGKLKKAVSKRSELVSRTDMDKLKCKICTKVYSSEKKLQNHQNNKHMIVYKANSGKPQKRVSFSDNVVVHEMNEYHKCRKCPKIFLGYKMLKLHMKKKHKKRKCYICNYCSKKFVDRIFFKVHIKLHCDLCGLLLSNKSEYLDHRRNVCRILKLYKCKTCGDAFYRIMDMKDHSYSHMDGVFVCEICKDQCKSLCSLAHHISFLHSENRPTSLYTMRNLGSERLYLCNFCEESSVERDVIENHTELLPDLNNKVMTGYKDYYFCDHCFLKFDTEPDMVQHKWTHFLKSSDNSQIRKEEDEPNKKVTKLLFKVGEEIPAYMQPKVILTKLQLNEKVLTESDPSVDANLNEKVLTESDPSVDANLNEKVLTESDPSVDANNLDVLNGKLKKQITGPKNRKTLISKHKCENCGKYFSTNYTLNRHMTTQHGDYEKLRCKVCEEVFVWPSLLRSHKCIRTYIPQQTFDDARPEIQIENDPINRICTNGFSELPNGFEDLGINYDDDYMQSVDFEIPAPIVELRESDAVYVPNTAMIVKNGNIPSPLNQLLIDGTGQNPNYRISLQEVPIEF